MTRSFSLVLLLGLAVGSASCRSTSRVEAYDAAMLADISAICIRPGEHSTRPASTLEFVEQLRRDLPQVRVAESCREVDALLVYTESNRHVRLEHDPADVRGSWWWTAEIYVPATAEKQHLKAFLYGDRGPFARSLIGQASAETAGLLRNAAAGG